MYNFADIRQAEDLAERFVSSGLELGEWVVPTNGALQGFDNTVRPDLFDLVRFYIQRDWT